ncbi:hypothetical protein AMELA_G00193740 [Ameiurus melas]|uniref:Uncharacterized protein n=1 Tax=Ameiurus melas TaxID=219545 RepID=A0A7J6A571_AMEME|nr:hypothetical protein AMELA_G00193740 [Ameiurus melas]
MCRGQSNITYVCISMVTGKPGAYPRKHRARGGVPIHRRPRLHTPIHTLQTFWTHQSAYHACLWTGGGNRSTQRKPPQHGGHVGNRTPDPGDVRVPDLTAEPFKSSLCCDRRCGSCSNTRTRSGHTAADFSSFQSTRKQRGLCDCAFGNHPYICSLFL